MAGEGGDDVRVLDFLIEIADEGAAGHVAGGNLADRSLVLLSGERVDDGDHPVDADNAEYLADALVVLLRGDERTSSAASMNAIS